MVAEKGGIAHPSNGNGNKWAFGLFDCFAPVNTCCLGCWCPCVIFGTTPATHPNSPRLTLFQAKRTLASTETANLQAAT